MINRICRWLLAIILCFALAPASDPSFAATFENAEPRMSSALEEVVRDRDVIKQGIRSGRCDDTAGSRTYSFDEGIPVADGWLFLTGGSFALCSDDIVVFALYNPDKEILRILHAGFTGTVDNGRFLIDIDGRKIIVSQECLGNDPPRRFIISQGIPHEDIVFRDAFAAAFRGLASRLDMPTYSYFYSRNLSFHGRDRAPRLDLAISRATGDAPAVASSIVMIYSEADSRVTVISPGP